MTNELSVPAWLAVLIIVGMVALVAVVLRLRASVRASQQRTEALVRAAARDAEVLRAELAAHRLDRTPTDHAERSARVPVAVVDDREYLITEMGQRSGPRLPAPVVPAPQFVDIVLRESVIKTAALAAGLRRALSAEARNRVRFEMRREVKRSRKQRKLMLREARRDREARQRAGVEVSP